MRELTLYSAVEYEVSTITKTSQVNLLADIVLQIAVAILYIITYSTYIYIYIIYAYYICSAQTPISVFC